MQLSFPYPTSMPVEFVAGVDEVGRGPLAGDVVAAAVILDPTRRISNLNDSKKMTQRQREYVFQTIVESALCYALGRASVAEIDSVNILQASLLAMWRAVMALSTQPGFVYVDGLHCPRWTYSSTAVVKGDSKVDCIAAASIVAKVVRDREMQELDSRYPGYGFAIHKGYPTKAHLLALQTQGATAVHRRSFKPVQLVLSQADT